MRNEIICVDRFLRFPRSGNRDLNKYALNRLVVHMLTHTNRHTTLHNPKPEFTFSFFQKKPCVSRGLWVPPQFVVVVDKFI